MSEPKVFFVHLRRPKHASQNPNEQRDDPFYEFGSFGCTKCHNHNLFHPRHARDLEGARLAFVQGGKLGSRLVFLTPPVSVTVWKANCEATWSPCDMPFNYAKAPVLAYNDGDSDFPLVEKFARQANCPTVEGGLCSRLRSPTHPIPSDMAREVVSVYTKLRAKARPSAIASTYDEALPFAPPKIDRNRRETYDRIIRNLHRGL